MVAGKAKRAAPSGRKILPLLRETYVQGLKGWPPSAESISSALGETVREVRGALEGAKAAGLVKVTRSRVELTPAGRGRLRVVMMGGAFEIIHSGHVHALTEAKSMGNTLVVVVATDESVEKNKGRVPVTPQDARVELVSSVRAVDAALPGNKGSIYEILARIRPDIVALGYDQHHNSDVIVQEASKRGIQLRTARLGAQAPGLKTSKILESF